MAKVSVDFEFPELEGHMGMPEFFEGCIPWGVGDDQRDHGREHQDHAAGSLDVHEAFYRDEPLGYPWDGDLVGALADRLVGHSVRLGVGLELGSSKEVASRRLQAGGHEKPHPKLRTGSSYRIQEIL